jgi:hypothetical protein
VFTPVEAAPQETDLSWEDTVEPFEELAVSVTGEVGPDAELGGEARETAHELLERAGTPGFAAWLQTQPGDEPWAHADTPELAGLEQWAKAIAGLDRALALQALLRAARFALGRIVAEIPSGMLVEMGVTRDAPSKDGAPVETQLDRCEAYLSRNATFDEVQAAFDPTRQLNVWDDDLRPTEQNAWFWITEVGQCCCSAILRGDKETATTASSYDGWSWRDCIARGFVVAVRAVRRDRAETAGIIDAMSSDIALAAS